MSPSYDSNPTAAPHLLLRAAACRPDRPFGSALTPDDLLRLGREHDFPFEPRPHGVYNTALTLFAFLSQCLAPAKTCAAAVGRVLVLRLAFDLTACSSATGGYCRARARIPTPLLRGLTHLLADRLEEQAPRAWRWKGRRAVVADGTTLSGPDTPANQDRYPQSKSQKEGLGFPLLRLVVLIGLATAALLGAALAPWTGVGNGETSLLRQLYDRLREGDVLLLDAGFCSYWTLALRSLRRVDVVTRLKEPKWSRASSGRRLGRDDHLVRWTKPGKCPAWMDRPTYDAFPDTLELREVGMKITTPGFRPRGVVVLTTLVDGERHPADDIRELYRSRWQVELDIRSLKSGLGMDILAGKTPEMLEREVWGHLLAYNVVRRLQAQAALARGRRPRELSFTASRQLLADNGVQLAAADDARHARLVEALVRAAGSRRVGNRPDRCEPRKRKRRPKDGKLLTKPRAEARAEAAAGKEDRQSKRRRGKKGKGASAPSAAAGVA